MVEPVGQRRQGRLPPLPLPLLRPGASPYGQPDRGADQGVKQPIEGTKTVKLLEEPLDHCPRLGIGINVDITRGEEHIAQRDTMEQRAALGFVKPSPLQALPHRMACDCAHGALPAEEEPIMRIAGLVDPVLIGEEGTKQRTHFQQMMPVFRAARQATHLQAPTRPTWFIVTAARSRWNPWRCWADAPLWP